MKILITGADGFIGKALCKYYDKNKIVYERFTGDVTDLETFPKESFDIIIHSAALITHKKTWSEGHLEKVNIGGTENIITAYPNAKIVYISTTDVSKEPLTAYAATKLKAEELVKRNVNNLIIRLPSVFGPNQKQDKLIPRLIRHYYSGEPCVVSSDDIREYAYVEDVAEEIADDSLKQGIITLKGIRIRNFRIKEIIESIYHGNQAPSSSEEEQNFINQLNDCCIEYKKIKKT